MKTFSGEVLFLDRDDINTDEIIPAKYLTEITKEALKPYLLEDLKLEGFSTNHLPNKKVVITKENFGCGSSREHAPWAFEVNNINAIIATSYARIFKQNMYNCGMLAIELPKTSIQEIFDTFKEKLTIATIDIQNQKLILTSDATKKEYSFVLEGFERALIEAGGWVSYADKKY